MAEKNIVAEIVERRKKDIDERGYTFGFDVPEKRTRPVNPFMEKKAVILEVKRASPSKGDIAPGLDAAETAKKYAENGAGAISCLTEENYFKGNLGDLMAVCNAVPNVAVLRKDFLIDEEEIDVAYRCGADAVLLISGILSLEKMLSMTERCKSLGIRALVEVRTPEDAQKVLEVKKLYADTIVCGVNSRNLKDFSIDLLVPCMLKKTLGGRVIFESGITTGEAAAKIGSMGFTGMLLGEFAARNPSKAGEFVKSFLGTDESLCGKALVDLAEKVASPECKKPLVKICGLTRKEDVLLADSFGADFVGFIFARQFGRNVWGERFESIKEVLPLVKAKKVAVVTDPDSEECAEAAALVKQGVLDFVQLHGVSPSSVSAELSEVPHYFALTDKNGTMAEQADVMNAVGEPRFLQDSKSHLYGGTEHLWIAGGITCENVEELVAKFNPELVDVSGGIEGEELGVKDKNLMELFFKKLNR